LLNQKQNNIINSVALGFRRAKNIGIYGVFCSESLNKTRKHHLFDDFRPLRDWEKIAGVTTKAATTTTTISSTTTTTATKTATATAATTTTTTTFRTAVRARIQFVREFNSIFSKDFEISVCNDVNISICIHIHIYIYIYIHLQIQTYINICIYKCFVCRFDCGIQACVHW